MKKFFVLILSLLLCVTCSGCVAAYWYNWFWRLKEEPYYSNKDNFVSVTAMCEKISISERNPDRYLIYVTDMEYEITEGDSFVDYRFEVIESNSAILKEAGIEEKLSPGDVFTFISAPGCYTNGYHYPIVALEIDGEVLLDFETGHKNLMDTY